MKTLSSLTAIEKVLKLKLKESRRAKLPYHIPSLWLGKKGTPKRIPVNPFAFYLDAIANVKKGKPVRRGKPSGGEWTKGAIIYNMFVRTTTAFDHNGNGVLDLPVNSDGFRETGTFLKAIAMLPYIKRLGANTIHLLPITSIGHDGNKGALGSPYAIRNPYELDENQSEPALGLNAKTEFTAFVEAAHTMGFRVVVEFVFRTAAKDSDWVKEHPEWMYWIKEQIQLRDPHSADPSKYGSPIFTPQELERIHHDVRDHRLDNLLPPHQQYRDFFTLPPAPEKVIKEDGRYIGRLDDGAKVKIPGAFADWPPDDSQPPWGDVTYLRMYTHPDFNYIGYNTIRMYDTRLTQEQYINRPLWERIVGIIPYYQREFHIDGVMIDMGHALPMELKAQMVSSARSNDPDFAFWDENFSVTQRSREEGYNAVVGYTWTDEHRLPQFRALCERFATEGFPIPFFGTPETHNTPRAAARPGGLQYAKVTMVLNSFLPVILFLHSGYEIAERYPINTGLDFTPEDLKKLPSEKLPLFSEYGYNWLSKEHFTELVTKVLSIRKKYEMVVLDFRPQSFRVLDGGSEHVLAYARLDHSPKKRLAVVGNCNYASSQVASVRVDTKKRSVVDLLSGKRFAVKDDHVTATLAAGQSLVFEF